MSEVTTKLRAFVAGGIVVTGSTLSWRIQIISATSKAEAIGIFMQNQQEENPGMSFQAPDALEVTAENLAEIGVTL